ncbi:MAG: hypothetical protein RIA63_08285, partial [Cyclobacteriaceae bacterium]
MEPYFKNFKFYIVLSMIFALQSCKYGIENKTEVIEIDEKTLFSSIPAMETGIQFINHIPESAAMNSMVYEYYYNGGGVAIGDIDN